jgi:hypothetical protein
MDAETAADAEVQLAIDAATVEGRTLGRDPIHPPPRAGADCAVPLPPLNFGGPPETTCFGRRSLLEARDFPRAPADEAGVRQLPSSCPRASGLEWPASIGESCFDLPTCDEPLDASPNEAEDLDATLGSCCYVTQRVCGV